MARIRDITPAFEAFARKAFVESPINRDQLWERRYEAAEPDVFEAFYGCIGEKAGRAAVVRELSLVRERARAAVTAVSSAIEELEPVVREMLGVAPEPSPLHVLMVGPYSTNAIVGRLGDDVTLFHCLEWYHHSQATGVLVAHEDAHAWHELALGKPVPEDDVAAMAFAEGMAIQVSRAAVPGRAEDEYFWYGHEGFEAWLPWCQEHHDELLARFAAEVDAESAADTWFGSGLVEQQWRVGYYVADQLVAGLGRPPSEMVAMSIDDGKAAIRAALA